MRICMIIPYFFPHIGGAEKLFLDFAKGIISNNHEVRIVTSSIDSPEGHKIYEGIDVYYYKWHKFYGHPIPRKSDVTEHIKWCDIIHTAPFTTANFSRKLAKKYNKPIIITIHEVLYHKWYWIEMNKIKASLFLLFERYNLDRPYTIKHFYSKSTEQDYFNSYGKINNYKTFSLSIDDNCAEISNDSTITLHSVFGVSNNSKCFLFYGRPGQSKGIFVYLKAIYILVKNKPEILENVNFCFLLANDPIKEKERFLKLVQSYHLQEYIKVQSPLPRKDLFHCIKDADYIVVPSITEGFGLSAAEACTMNKKLIYSNGGSLPEVVSGYCLEFQNRNPNDLAKKINKAIKLDNKAFTKIPTKSFPVNKMNENLIELYKNIMEKWTEIL